MHNKDNGFREEKRGRSNYRRAKRKLCAFCVDKVAIDYKDVAKLKRFLSDRAKIIPRRVSGCCARHQRQVTAAIKCARVVALLPYVND